MLVSMQIFVWQIVKNCGFQVERITSNNTDTNLKQYGYAYAVYGPNQNLPH
jgi:hypothetical protein